MSEFKFACPVCGQHITADSSTSGGHLECPTCFQKIVIPQAPASPDSKFILSATQVGKPRPVVTNGDRQNVKRGLTPATKSLIATVAFFTVLCAVAALAFVFRDKLFRKGFDQSRRETGSNSLANKKPTTPITSYPIPTNIVWSLELTNAVFQDSTAAGSIHGKGFFCERAILQGGHLTLRQGASGTADLGVTVLFFANQGEDLSGKKIEVSSDRQPPLPKVLVRWRDDNQKAITHSFTSGYTLKVVFGNAENGRMPGKIYLSLPDDQQSVIAGTFDAEIRKPPPPKPKSPEAPKAKTSG